MATTVAVFLYTQLMYVQDSELETTDLYLLNKSECQQLKNMVLLLNFRISVLCHL